MSTTTSTAAEVAGAEHGLLERGPGFRSGLRDL